VQLGLRGVRPVQGFKEMQASHLLIVRTDVGGVHDGCIGLIWRIPNVGSMTRHRVAIVGRK